MKNVNVTNFDRNISTAYAVEKAVEYVNNFLNILPFPQLW